MATIVTAIGRLGNASHVPRLAPFLNHPSPRVVANAVSSIFTLSPEEGFALTAHLLNSSDNRVKGNVVMILAEKDPAQCLTEARKMGRSRMESHRATAIYCLRQLEPEASVEILLDMFVREDVTTLAEGEGELLAKRAGSAAVPTLIQLAALDPDREVQVRSVVQAVAGRLNWSPEDLARHYARIRELAKARAVQPAPALGRGGDSGRGAAGTVKMTAESFLRREAVDGVQKLNELIRHSIQIIEPKPNAPADKLVVRDILNDRVTVRVDGHNKRSALRAYVTREGQEVELKTQHAGVEPGDEVVKKVEVPGCEDAWFYALTPTCVVVKLSFGGMEKTSATLVDTVQLQNWHLAQ